MPTSLLLVFIANLLIELFVAYILGYRRKTVLCAVGLVNLLTNPLLNYIIWTGLASSLLSIFILEVAVVILEAYALGFALRNKARKYILLSLAMNIASFGMGCLINALAH